jgi:hypothetical protein
MSIVPQDLWAEVQRLEELEARYLEMVDESEGVVTQAVEMVEAGLVEFRGNAIESLHWYIREAEATVAACQAEEKRLAEVKRRAQARIPWAKQVVNRVLDRKGVRKMKAGTITAALRQAPEKVVPSGEEEPIASLLPERFQTIKISANKTEIKQALRDGETVDGYKLGRDPDSVVLS